MAEFLCHELAANGESTQLEAFLRVCGNKCIGIVLDFPFFKYKGKR